MFECCLSKIRTFFGLACRCSFAASVDAVGAHRGHGLDATEVLNRNRLPASVAITSRSPLKFLIGLKLQMTVSHWSRTQPFAGRQNPPQCHLLDYIIHSPGLRSVDLTAAAKDNSTLLAGDATAASLSGGEIRAVPSLLLLPSCVSLPHRCALDAGSKRILAFGTEKSMFGCRP